MANQLSHLLSHWYPNRRDRNWVLGTVYKTEGPCYRKAGAMMLFNDLGQQFGMLSGGCLESDIQKHAVRVMQEGRAITLRYDGNDEDDLSFRLGIGCGGIVHILLQPLTAENQYLMLDVVHQALKDRRLGCFYQRIPDRSGQVDGYFVTAAQPSESTGSHLATLVEKEGSHWLATPVFPPPHLLVAGGGVDARPLVAMAIELGWQVSLWDPRPANARREFFMGVDQILRSPDEELACFVRQHTVDAAVLMTHNMGLDSRALSALRSANLKYLAILGPQHRRNQVLEVAGVVESELGIPVAGPAGLDLGAKLPEDIALSILAECQACLNRRSGRSISGILD